jgi:hypothetical protein
MHWNATALSIAKQLKTSFDMDIRRIELCSALVGIKRIVDLIITGFILFGE